MQPNTWPIRLAFIIAAIAIGGYFLYPTAVYFTLDDAALAEVRADKAAFAKHLPSWAPDNHVVPGLDLQGGVHMVLGVDLDKAIADKARSISSRMRDELADKKVAVQSVEHLLEEGKGDRLRVTFTDEAALATFDADIAENYSDLAEVGRTGRPIASPPPSPPPQNSRLSSLQQMP